MLVRIPYIWIAERREIIWHDSSEIKSTGSRTAREARSRYSHPDYFVETAISRGKKIS
jgi:hypothetical protein